MLVISLTTEEFCQYFWKKQNKKNNNFLTHFMAACPKWQLENSFVEESLKTAKNNLKM